MVNQTDNEEVYYGKMADELIRFRKIRNYILTSHNFLSFQEIPYNLKDDEIILLEELLYGDYFDNIESNIVNKFIKTKNIYDLADPIEGMQYQNKFNLDIGLETHIINNCVVSGKNTISLGHWKDPNLARLRFNKGLKKNPDKIHREIRDNIIINKAVFKDFEVDEYKRTFGCTWELLVTIINDSGKNIKKEFLIHQLVEIYEELFKGPQKEQILSILKREGKVDQTSAIQNGTNLIDVITESNYYLTLIDIFLLSKHFGISCVLLCRTKISLFGKEFISYIDDKNSHSYYIYCSKFNEANSETTPIYGLLNKNGNIQISNSLMGDDYDIFKNNNINNIEEFIKNVAIKNIKLKKRVKKLKIKIII